jgi:predicted lysophospholipase L1 biosynthesis ABC-type transport system permease subunit
MLVATSVQYRDSVAIGGLRRAVLDAAPADRGVAVQLTATPDQVAGLDTAVSGVLTQALGPVAPVVLALRSTSLAPVGLASDQAAGHLTVVAGYTDLAGHARLTAGSWPVAGRNPVEASLSAAAATALGVRIGDQVSLADAATPGPGPPR